MRGRALILGSQTYGLTGVLGDAGRVAGAMAARGFDVTCCLGEAASRAGILAHYRHLIEACAPGDAAFVYYAGHGAWAPEPGLGFQFLVPADFERSTDEDFRGITALEWSALAQELTARTLNVSLVLDCCYAARMCRGLGPTPRSLPTVPVRLVRAHLARLRERGVPLGGRHIESNPDAVRLVAAGIDELAYEYTNTRGERTGLLTEAFLEVLEEARGLRVSWGQLGERVRERVLARCPQQRPELEGPGRRLLFGLEELEAKSSLAYYPERNHHWLRGGRLHGVHVGDAYCLMPLGASGPDEARALALAQAVEVGAGACRVRLEHRAAGPLPTGAPAFLLRSAQLRRPVGLEGPWDARPLLGALLREGLQASGLVRPVAPDERGPVLAHVRLGERGVDVLDSGLDRIVHPLPPTPPSIPRLLNTLETQARAQALRELGEGEASERFDAWLELEWGRVLERRARALPSLGASLHAGERVYVRLRNRGPGRLYVSVLDVGVGGVVTLLSASQPSGLVLGAGQGETLGARPDGTLVGLELEWPGDTPRQDARPESLVLLASRMPVDLRSLETSRSRAVPAPPGAVDLPVDPLLQQWMHSREGGSGELRRPSVPAEALSPGYYGVKHIRFWLDPRPLR